MVYGNFPDIPARRQVQFWAWLLTGLPVLALADPLMIPQVASGRPDSEPSGAVEAESDAEAGREIRSLEAALRSIKRFGPGFETEAARMTAAQVARELTRAQGLEEALMEKLAREDWAPNDGLDRGLMLMAQGRFEEAEAWFLEAAARCYPGDAPASARACLRAGDACFFAGKMRSALSHCRAGLVAIAKEPDTVVREIRALLHYDLAFMLGKLTREEPSELKPALLKEALAAVDICMKIWRRESSPQNWAESSLLRARILHDQTGLFPEKERLVGLKAVENSTRACLEVTRPTENPRLWMTAQSTLAVVLLGQAAVLPHQSRAELQMAAVAALRAGLEFADGEALPARRAVMQHHLGIALQRLSLGQTYQDGFRSMVDAMAAYAAAQDFYTKEAYPRDWANLQTNVALLCRMLAAQVKPARKDFYLRHAAEAYTTAMEVLTRQDFPELWADAQRGRGEGLMEWALTKSGQERKTLLKEAAACLRSAMEILTEAADSQKHHQVRKSLKRIQELADTPDSAAASDLR